MTINGAATNHHHPCALIGDTSRKRNGDLTGKRGGGATSGEDVMRFGSVGWSNSPRRQGTGKRQAPRRGPGR